MSKLNIIGPGYEGRSKSINSSRCINFYPEIESQDSKSVVALIGTPGCSYWQSVADNVRGGMHAFNDLMYYCANDSLYSVDINRNISGPLGSNLSTSTGRVIYSDNGLSPTGGDQLLFSDGVKTYCYDVANSNTTTVDIASSINCFIGGYFVADLGSGGRFRWSDLLDGTTWDAANFATAESSPDDLVSIFNNHGELWLLGEYSTEVWYQTGNSTSPFARVSGGVVDYGCAAKYSVSQCNNTIYWLGTIRNNNQSEFIGVCKASGYGVEVVSPVPITYKISKYNVIDDAFSYTYTMEGHEFYVLTFPGENVTWAYDTTTKLWHEWSTYSDDPYKINRHLSEGYCKFKGRHFVSDYRNNYIMELSSNVYTDNNEPIVSTRICNHLYDSESLDNIFISKLQLDCEVGLSSDYFDRNNAYSIFTTNDTSSTNVVLTVNGVEVINTYLSETDVVFSNPLPLIFMVALNFGLNNWPTSGGYWENSEWTDRVTYNANNTITLQLPTHTATIYPHYAPISAVMSPANGVTQPANLILPQYPDIEVYSIDPVYEFSLILENPYADNISSIEYKIPFVPQIALSFSDDGGHTFGKEFYSSLGKVGEYKNQVIWRRLGYSKNRVFRFSISDPVKKVINAQYIEVIK